MSIELQQIVIPACPHRGRIAPASQQCFCRHPAITGTDSKSVPVSFRRCQACIVPQGGEIIIEIEVHRPRTSPCASLGPILDTTPCPTCGGTRDIAIRACERHARCVQSKGDYEAVRTKEFIAHGRKLAKRLPLKCCETCKDYQASG